MKSDSTKTANQQHWQWWTLCGLSVMAFGLGVRGFLLPAGELGQVSDLPDAIYYSMKLFHMQFTYTFHPIPWELQVARFLAPLTVGFAAVKGFIFVAHSHRRAFLHSTKSDHIVICGLGQKGLHLAKEYRDKKECVVIIEKDPDNEFLSACDAAGIFYWIGDAADPAVLAQARVTHAKEVVVITSEDETNVRIAMQIKELSRQNNSKRLECFVQLANIHLRERLQRLFANDSKKNAVFVLRFFDAYDDEARRLLWKLPLDGSGISKDDPRSVHVVILGFGSMGRSIALRAAKMGHFANGKPLRITVVDRIAARQREHFLFHYPALETEPICQLTFHQAEAESPEVRKLILGWAAEPHTLLHLFVCVGDNAGALELGLRLQEVLADQDNCNLCVRIRTQASLADILKLSPDTKPRLEIFGKVEDACSNQTFRHIFNESIARALHQGYRKDMDRRRAAGEEIPPKPAEVSWEELAEEFKESNRQAADHIPIKVRALGCHIGDLNSKSNPIRALSREQKRILAPLEHTRWCADRWLGGWTLCKQRDDDHHRHTDLKAWRDLNDAEKRIDHAQIEQLADALAAERKGIFDDKESPAA